MTKPRLMYFVSEDWYMISHRLPLAEAALREGYEVTIVTRLGEGKDRLERAGFRTIPFHLDRRSLNPLSLLRSIRQLARILRIERPTVLHNVALKPAVVGAAAAMLARVPHVVNAVAGLGWLCSSEGKNRYLSRLARPLLGWLLGRSILVVQNPEDHDFFRQAGVPEEKISLIRGAGVNVNQFLSSPEPTGTPVVMLASRLLWDKGVGEFVDAARALKTIHPAVRFVLVGAADYGNPAAVHDETLQTWVDQGVVEWWGLRKDMPQVLQQATIVCLPSYREGFPKVLLEAAASARAIVTTNVPGCRDAVIDGVTGLLVEVRNTSALLGAIDRLLRNPDLRSRLAQAARQRVEGELSQETVIAQTLALYRILSPCPSS